MIASETITVTINLNRVWHDSWLEWRGDRWVGMGRIIERMPDGKLVRDETSPTGLEAWYE